jgi:hypothetical protein
LRDQEDRGLGAHLSETSSDPSIFNAFRSLTPPTSDAEDDKGKLNNLLDETVDEQLQAAVDDYAIPAQKPLIDEFLQTAQAEEPEAQEDVGTAGSTTARRSSRVLAGEVDPDVNLDRMVQWGIELLLQE